MFFWELEPFANGPFVAGRGCAVGAPSMRTVLRAPITVPVCKPGRVRAMHDLHRKRDPLHRCIVELGAGRVVDAPAVAVVQGPALTESAVASCRENDARTWVLPVDGVVTPTRWRRHKYDDPLAYEKLAAEELAVEELARRNLRVSQSERPSCSSQLGIAGPLRRASRRPVRARFRIANEVEALLPAADLADVLFGAADAVALDPRACDHR